MNKREAIFGLGGLVLGTAIGAAVYHKVIKKDREELEQLRNDKEDLEAMKEDYKNKLDELNGLVKDLKKECNRFEESNNKREESFEPEEEELKEYEDIIDDWDYSGHDLVEEYGRRKATLEEAKDLTTDFCLRNHIDSDFVYVVYRYLRNEHEEHMRDVHGYTSDMYPEVITKDAYINQTAPNDPHETDPIVLDCIIYPEEGIVVDTNTNEEIEFMEGFVSIYNLKEFGDDTPGYLFTYSYYFNLYCMCRLAGKGCHWHKGVADDRDVGEEDKILKEYEPQFIDPDDWMDVDGQEAKTLDFYQEDGIWADERGYVMPTSWDPKAELGECARQIMQYRIDVEDVEYFYVRNLRTHTDYEICLNGCAYDVNDYIQ